MKMSLIYLALGAGLMSTSVLAETLEECREKAASNVEVYECGTKALKAEDAKLNVIYKKVISGLKADPQAFGADAADKLKTAQRAWLKFRDAECEFQAVQMFGGNGAHAIVTDCLRDLTIKRTSELEAFKESALVD